MESPDQLRLYCGADYGSSRALSLVFCGGITFCPDLVKSQKGDGFCRPMMPVLGSDIILAGPCAAQVVPSALDVQGRWLSGCKARRLFDRGSGRWSHRRGGRTSGGRGDAGDEVKVQSRPHVMCLPGPEQQEPCHGGCDRKANQADIDVKLFIQYEAALDIFNQINLCS